MKNPTLNNSSKTYLEEKRGSSKISPSKEGKIRFDLAEGLWEKSDLASLPDRTSSKLKDKLSNFLNLDSSNLSIHAGADEIIEIIPRMYLDRDDRVIVIVPTFDRLLATNKKVGAEVINFELSATKNFRFEDEEYQNLEVAIKSKKPKIIWMCTPNNPTGQIIDLQFIDKIAGESPDILIVVDEAYQEYSSLNPKESAVSLLSKHNNLLVIRSFSKAFALAGARVGCAISNPEMISKIENFRTMFNVSTSAQRMGIKSLTQSKINYVEDKISKIHNQMIRFVSKIKSLSNYELIEDSKTNFIFIRHKSKDLFEELYKRGLAVSDWRFAPGVIGKGYVRISINTPSLNTKILDILEKIN
ncbi:MAG: Histidinol-phosphate aminotransferase [Candidatus Collierbacteria bacterium GW2011_GWB1_45_35]|uniref:Aminotransferase n=1 Tax=Candidatus Collierbacteria bacterium GW2011_GWB2_45_17 TaxID=1618388 RepID=A0A837IIY2_9BACT|nr:MAG: Histidinol-phosphate aminotransferase [Microgenomates group bacterium GW2011_GWC1_44_23]KKT96283.1 MAG: Histidinol-phosphate aminotransferase [Candidatus Collierbacteria bacterium GW2011_GWA1_45_15]KKU01323.1 MAG: Histidinol-phosphate aminotransferase [Candidatus Collierbacteria bacterium GW2011_GWB2_45_17]KKU05026.1 MAG: Histidinol-phosphate aminotransferase [Candidatus Collierbacteria bacterium GW2011_GWB1_45_35]HCX25783.1 hypothetical protein [Candidatus Collierbacteria bacterium]